MCVRVGGDVSVNTRLRSIVLCLVLEFGAIAGVPMPPEKIRALMDSINQPKLAHVLPAEDDDGGGPPKD
jgi:hypothetical protein